MSRTARACCESQKCFEAPREGIVFHYSDPGSWECEWTVEVVNAAAFEEAHGMRTPREVAQAYAEAREEYERELAAEYRAEMGEP